MATIKSYTSLDQSKKLAEILPLESADMMWKKELKYRICSDEHKVSESDFIYCPIFKEEKVIMSNFDVPCWSLSALLSVLPDSIYDNTDEYSQLEFTKKSVAYHDINDGIKVGAIKENLVDACYELVLKLHERKML